MKNQLLHTPDGVRDIYNGECEMKLYLQEKLHKVLLSYGFHDIQTPTFEFFNIFSSEIGTTPSKDLYKFFDKEGNTLVLRPDFTPSIARSVVKYYIDEEMPVKLCYMGNTFINSSDYQGRLKENTQCGAELIGDGSVSADAEILSMVVDSLKTSGLKEFQIAVGHAQFFKGLVEEAHIEEEDEAHLRELISNKNFFGVEEFVEKLNVPSELQELFSLLRNFNLTEADLSAAKEKAKAYSLVFQALDELEKLNHYLKIYKIEDYVSFELGIISDYHYYTGIIFAGYTFGTGEAVVKGGRYDKLFSYFGKNAPAIGFAIVVDQLMASLSRQKITVSLPDKGILLIFKENKAKEAIARAKELRSQGALVETLLWAEDKTKADYEAFADKNKITTVEFMDGE